MYVQEFLGAVKVDGDVVADGTVTANEVTASGNVSAGGNLSAAAVTASGQITADSIRVGTPNRFYIGERNLNLTIGAGTVVFLGCSGTVNTTGTGAKVLYLVGCPSLTVNNNGSAKTYRDGFAVGSIFQTTGTDSPAAAFGGNWEQLTADAYFKIVTANAGTLGGTSPEHKMPIESMPNHTHPLANNDRKPYAVVNPIGTPTTQSAYFQAVNDGNAVYAQTYNTNAAGGGEAYYPYYYGIYAWRRINVSGQE